MANDFTSDDFTSDDLTVDDFDNVQSDELAGCKDYEDEQDLFIHLDSIVLETYKDLNNENEGLWDQYWNDLAFNESIAE